MMTGPVNENDLPPKSATPTRPMRRIRQPVGQLKTVNHRRHADAFRLGPRGGTIGRGGRRESEGGSRTRT